MSDERNCATCAHRHGLVREFWKCQATGWFCSTEAKYGGICRRTSGFALWEPRRPIQQRVIRFFVGAKA